MSTSTPAKTCPKCGGPIPPEAPQGLCPKCLLQEVSIPTETGKGAIAKSDLPSREALNAAFPHLEILELVGQGAMGIVYKARQPKLDRFVALKILSQSLASDVTFTERFTREGRLLAKLSHPNIVTVHDFGQANGFFYLLMEFVNGVNLRQAMQAGRFTPAQALALVPDVCEALQYAHTQGILHRDIKPENILLDANGRIKIADFGIAKLLGEAKAEGALTGSGAAIGTPHYMAPEQIEKPAEVDHRADIYSLGVVLYEMLTGELPLGKFPPPSQKTPVNAGVDALVLRVLEKERERRYQTADAVKTAVQGLTAERTSTTPAHPLPSWSKRAAILFIVLGVLAWVPSFFTFGTNYFIWRPDPLVMITGIALFTRRSIWRGVALLCNLLIVAAGLLGSISLASSLASALASGRFDWPGAPGFPYSPFVLAFLEVVKWVGPLAGLVVLLRPDVRAGFQRGTGRRGAWLTVAALLAPIVIIGLPHLVWRLGPHPSEPAVELGPAGQQASKVLEFRLPIPPPPGFEDKRKLALETVASLFPEESIEPLLEYPDGRRVPGHWSITSSGSNPNRSCSIGLSWWLPQDRYVQDTISIEEISRVRALLTDTVVGKRMRLYLYPDHPHKMFTLTNNYGGVLAGYLTYRSEIPAPGVTNAASVRIPKAYWDAIWNTHFNAELETNLPKGYALACSGLSLGGLEQQTRIMNFHHGDSQTFMCTWYPPSTFKQAEHDEAVRQLQGAAFTLRPRERRMVFAVTNAAGEDFHGYIELIPPSTFK
jgi:tRNA A-37 threonylcarbamoyl transferase component Bud32